MIKNWRASLLLEERLTWKSISPCLSCPTEYPREMRHDLNSSGASLPDLDLSKWLKEARNSFSCSWVMPLLSRVRIWFSTSLIVRFTGGGEMIWCGLLLGAIILLFFPRSERGAKGSVRGQSVTVIYFSNAVDWGRGHLSVSCCLAIRKAQLFICIRNLRNVAATPSWTWSHL